MINSNLLKIKVTPRAKSNQIVGLLDGVIHVKVKSPPSAGKANNELIDFLCTKLKLKKTDVNIIHGFTSRNKLIELTGISFDEALIRLNIKPLL